jgi:hypothetical protein
MCDCEDPWFTQECSVKNYTLHDFEALDPHPDCGLATQNKY